MAQPRGGRGTAAAKSAPAKASAKAEAPAAPTPATSATVTIAGVRGSFTVDFTQDKTTIGQVVTEAAKQAGVPDLVVTSLAVVVNGENASLSDRATPGAKVAAAPKVRNG